MTLTIDRDGERLDSALSRLVPELTRSQAQRLIEQGRARHHHQIPCRAYFLYRQ